MAEFIVILGILVILALYVVYVIISWKIAEKAGFSGRWALVLLIPVAGIIMIWIFAFTKWPIEEEEKKSIELGNR